MKLRLSFLFLFVSFFAVSQVEKHRLMVLTDIEADPDDAQTLVRLLLYSNQIDIEGLVATTSTHQRKRVAPESIDAILEAYGKVQPNLLKHEAGFPSEASLKALVKKGAPSFGMLGVGKGKDSEGSDWIIEMLERKDDRPLYVSVWGGPNVLAQALFKLRKTKSKKQLKKLVSKLRVYTISDQDDSAFWIRKEFPELFYIVSPGGYFGATWIAVNQPIKGINNQKISNQWIADNIQQSHGPLGTMYPDVAYGMEGDTPAFLSVIPNGLNNPEKPNWGAWGGRYELYKPENVEAGGRGIGFPIEQETRPIWTNANDKFTPRVANEYGSFIKKDTISFDDNWVTLWRWRDDFQNDFAARMDWCLNTFEEANHPPVPAVNHKDVFTVKSSEIFSLDATGTTDPDGDSLSYWWFHYQEAGSYKETLNFIPFSENLYNVHTVVAPEVTKKETLHFILKVTDKGTPALSRYKRVIVTVEPK